jgi:hypothetical protein
LRPSGSYGRNRRDFCRVARQSVSKAATAPTSWTGGAGSDTLDHICLVMHGTFAVQHVLKNFGADVEANAPVGRFVRRPQNATKTVITGKMIIERQHCLLPQELGSAPGFH